MRIPVKTQEPVKVTGDVIRRHTDYRLWTTPGITSVTNLAGLNKSMRILTVYTTVNNTGQPRTYHSINLYKMRGTERITFNVMELPAPANAWLFVSWGIGLDTAQVETVAADGLDTWTHALPDLILDNTFEVGLIAGGGTSTWVMYYEVFDNEN